MTRSHPAALLVPIAGLALAACSAAEPEVAPWARRYGDAADQTSITLAVDPVGGDLALTGSFSGALDLGGGVLGDLAPAQNDVFVGSLDAHGRHLWSGTSNADGNQTGRGAAFDAKGNTVFSGMFEVNVNFGTGRIDALSTDTFVAGFRPTGGGAQWVQHFAADSNTPEGMGTSDPFAGLVVDGGGDLVLGGFFSGTLDLGGPKSVGGPPLQTAPGDQTSFVAKLDPGGTQRWSAALGGASNAANAVAADAQGDVYLGGLNQGEIELDGRSFAATSPAGFVAAFGPAGDPRWLIQIGGAGTSDVRALAVDGAGDLLVAGDFSGQIQLGDANVPPGTAQGGFVAKLSAEGKTRWLKTLPGVIVSAVATDAGGAVLFGGSYLGQPALGGAALPFSTVSAAIYGELSPAGELGHVLTFGTDGDASSVSALAAAGSDVVLAGTFDGTLRITPRPLVSAGGTDLFVARLRR